MKNFREINSNKFVIVQLYWLADREFRHFGEEHVIIVKCLRYKPRPNIIFS